MYVNVVMHKITGGMGSWGRTFSSKTLDPRVNVFSCLFLPEFVHDSCELFILNIFFSCGHGAHNTTVAIGIAKRLEGMTKGL